MGEHKMRIAITVSSQCVCCVRRASTRHPLSERHGLGLTAFAAWWVDISHTGCVEWGEMLK